MREIKFRGKTEFGKWVYGVPIFNNGCAYILNTDFECQVIPETVGQYTGLKDKNGVEIYEGDVVCANWRDSNGYKFRCTGVVKFKDGSFCIVSSGSTLYRWMDYGEIEVIGNIHENPELVEVE